MTTDNTQFPYNVSITPRTETPEEREAALQRIRADRWRKESWEIDAEQSLPESHTAVGYHVRDAIVAAHYAIKLAAHDLPDADWEKETERLLNTPGFLNTVTEYMLNNPDPLAPVSTKPERPWRKPATF